MKLTEANWRARAQAWAAELAKDPAYQAETAAIRAAMAELQAKRPGRHTPAEIDEALARHGYAPE